MSTSKPPFGEATMLGGPDDGRALAYRGKLGCRWPTCTRMSTITDSCYGWHCAHCHEPCSSQGHTCKPTPPPAAGREEGTT